MVIIRKFYHLTILTGEMVFWLEIGISEFHSSSQSRWIKKHKVCVQRWIINARLSTDREEHT